MSRRNASSARTRWASPVGEPGPVVGGDDPGHQVEREQPLGLVVHPERDPAGPLLGVQRLLGGLHAADAHARQRAEHPAVLRQDVALLADRLVEPGRPVVARAAWAPVTMDGGRSNGRLPALGGGEQAVDDVGELAPQPEPAALAGRRAAAAERQLRQLRAPARSRPAPPAAGAGSRPAAPMSSTGETSVGPAGRRGRPPGPERAARQVAARSSSWRTAGSGTPGRALLAGPAHQRAEQAGDQHDEVDLGAGVADPQLDGRHVGARPDVEVDHPGVADRPRSDQVLDHPVVVGAASRPCAGGPAVGQRDQIEVAVARVAGVAAAPVRRAGARSPGGSAGRARRGGRPARPRRGPARRRAPARRRCAAR